MLARVVHQPSLCLVLVWMAEASGVIAGGLWEVGGAGLVARVPGCIVDQTGTNDSRDPANLGGKELGEESLFSGHADIDDSDDSCCILSRIYNSSLCLLSY